MVPVCACGCKTRIDHLRGGAKWLSKAHALRWLRANPGKHLSDAPKRYVGGTRRASGRQCSWRKAVEAGATLLCIPPSPDWTHAEIYETAERFLREALPERQRL